MSRCWILPNVFSAFIKMIVQFLPSLLLIQCITLMISDVKPTLHSWDKSPLVIMYDPFYMLLDLVEDFLSLQ